MSKSCDEYKSLEAEITFPVVKDVEINSVEDKKISKTTAWRRANPEKYKKSVIEYKEIQKQSNKKYKSNNVEKLKIRYEKYKPKRTQNRKTKLDELKDKSREWRSLNPEKSRESVKKWQANNPEFSKRMNSNRRARLLNAGGSGISKGIIEKLLKLQKSRCISCRCNLNKIKYHLDHIEPLSSGGLNEDSNVQLLCHSCNQKKHASDPIDFMQRNGYLL